MKLSDIYGYGTPSNRFVRPQSQRTENYGDNESIWELSEEEMDDMERSMSEAMGDESEYEGGQDS